MNNYVFQVGNRCVVVKATNVAEAREKMGNREKVELKFEVDPNVVDLSLTQIWLPKLTEAGRRVQI